MRRCGWPCCRSSTASDSIYWFDSDARVVYANQAACRALGYSPGELIGLLVTDINPTYPADAAQVARGARRAPRDLAAPLRRG